MLKPSYPVVLTSCVETFITVISHDIKSSKTKNLPRDNLTKSEREALLIYKKEMTSLSQKLTKEADKADRQLKGTLMQI